MYVPDIKVLECQLGTILIGNQKLSVNIPKYDRRNQNRVDVGKNRTVSIAVPNLIKGGVSLANVVQKETNIKVAESSLNIIKYQIRSILL